MKARISIIIVSYNTRDILRDCLHSIIRSNILVPYEIIVIDNASTDGSPDMITFEFREVKLIQNFTNNMFAKANNQAIGIANGDYLLLLNSDTTVKPNSIQLLIDFLDSRQQVSCVGPRVLNPNGTIQSEGKHHDDILSFLLYWVGLARWPLPVKYKRRMLPMGFPGFDCGEKRRVGWVAGCCMLIRKEAFMEVGLFDEELNFYCEETEWCYRACENGLEIWVLPESQIVHIGGASTNYKESPQSLDTYLTYRKKTIGLTVTVIKHLIIIFIFVLFLPIASIFKKNLVKSVFIPEIHRSYLLIHRVVSQRH